jgi:small subunit ribosomal protein S6
MRKYEIMLILPADADDRGVEGVSERIAQVIGKQDGEVTKVERWSKRRLAFEIQRLTEGLYLIVEFTADPSAIAEVERVLTLADEVIRFKVVVRAA